VRVSPFRGVEGNQYEAWSIRAPGSRRPWRNNLLHGTYQSAGFANLVVLQWDLGGQNDNIAENRRLTCRVLSEGSCVDNRIAFSLRSRPRPFLLTHAKSLY